MLYIEKNKAAKELQKIKLLINEEFIKAVENKYNE